MNQRTEQAVKACKPFQGTDPSRPFLDHVRLWHEDMIPVIALEKQGGFVWATNGKAALVVAVPETDLPVLSGPHTPDINKMTDNRMTYSYEVHAPRVQELLHFLKLRAKEVKREKSRLRKVYQLQNKYSKASSAQRVTLVHENLAFIEDNEIEFSQEGKKAAELAELAELEYSLSPWVWIKEGFNLAFEGPYSRTALPLLQLIDTLEVLTTLDPGLGVTWEYDKPTGLQQFRTKSALVLCRSRYIG